MVIYISVTSVKYWIIRLYQIEIHLLLRYCVLYLHLKKWSKQFTMCLYRADQVALPPNAINLLPDEQFKNGQLFWVTKCPNLLCMKIPGRQVHPGHVWEGHPGGVGGGAKGGIQNQFLTPSVIYFWNRDDTGFQNWLS